MPKLRQYIKDQNEGVFDKHHKHVATQRPPTEPSSIRLAETQPFNASAAATETHRFQQTAPLADDQLALASKKFHDAYQKRLREHGPRQFRWPDGSLREEKPPPNPYAASNRRKWSSLVHHCRTHGGDRAYEPTGHSLRYGINVTSEQHIKYLQQAQLQPERDEQGEYIGYNPSALDPLEDPEHALNSFYKEGAAAVFKGARGKLL